MFLFYKNLNSIFQQPSARQHRERLEFFIFEARQGVDCRASC